MKALQPFYPKKLLSSNLEMVKVFGLILFTERHPFLIKCLRDPDYWNALDEISGHCWIIYSVQPKEGKFIEPRPMGGGFLSMMVRTWQEPAENKALLKELGIEQNTEKPLFVVYMENNTGQVESVICEILGNDTESVYRSLQYIVKEVTVTIRQIDAGNLKKTENVFREVKDTINMITGWRKIKSGIRLAKLIKEWLF